MRDPDYVTNDLNESVSAEASVHREARFAKTVHQIAGGVVAGRPKMQGTIHHHVYEVVQLTKDGGPLTKRISLTESGTLKSDGSRCVMSTGRADRLRFAALSDFAEHIGHLNANQAIATGALVSSPPDTVFVETKSRLNGSGASDVIARTAEYIQYRPGKPALALLDIDTKGMPNAVKRRIEELGGWWSALTAVVPELACAARVTRSSTSSCISRSDTGDEMAGSNGVHVYVGVKDGADIELFLRTFHDRCWLHGFGWMIVGAGGQLLDRSLIDRMVYAPERLVFEASPELEPPLTQDHARRRPEVAEGEMLDARAVCPELGVGEKTKLRGLQQTEKARLSGEAAHAREAFVAGQAERIARRTGVSESAARKIAEYQTAGVLLPDVVLPFDDAAFESSTVGDVFADPGRFVGVTLSDPLEGPDYGRAKAKIMRRPDGSLWIHSFAHGRTTYELKHDFRSIDRAIRASDAAEAVNVVMRLFLHAVLNDVEEQTLRELVVKLSDVKMRPLQKMMKVARDEHGARRAEAERDAGSGDRIQLDCPMPEDERLPVLVALDDVLVDVRSPEPPMRDLDGRPCEIRSRPAMHTHELTSRGSNADDPKESCLPPPELPLITPHDKYSLAHLIERHVAFTRTTAKTTKSVALPPVFVEHYERYRDSTLPKVGAILTAPVVLRDGRLLAAQGLDRERGIVFRIAPELLKLLPTRAECTPRATADALDYLVNEWLVDVSADFAGKCVLVAYALSIIERSVISNRPNFYVTAGKRGGGKTTAINMVVLAVTGKSPPAAAWSSSEEKRRKALLSYLSDGLPTIVWDNIPTGTTISCPSIEKASTAETYADRILGLSEHRTVSASTIIAFTGNNIGPKGDSSSRALVTRIDTDRVDPENRPFKHPDPIGWTLAHRGEILRALYTILLGNPGLPNVSLEGAKTRFKEWWVLVGSAIENAARGPVDTPTAEGIDFNTMFSAIEADAEDVEVNGSVLEILHSLYGGEQFSAGRVAKTINDRSFGESTEATALRNHLDQLKRTPMAGSSANVTASAVGLRLRDLLGNTTRVGDTEYTLVREATSAGGESKAFRIRSSGATTNEAGEERM